MDVLWEPKIVFLWINYKPNRIENEKTSFCSKKAQLLFNETAKSNVGAVYRTLGTLKFKERGPSENFTSLSRKEKQLDDKRRSLGDIVG